MEETGDKRIIIFDTTLRDGEQSPGASMEIHEKLDIARQLARLGVDVIESGFPVSSQAQFEASRMISEEIEGPIIAGLCRANIEDIKQCYDAISGANKKRIHTFIATSPIHMEFKLKLKPEEVIKRAVEAVQFSKNLCDDVEFSCEDATRSEISFLKEICLAAVEAGATTINIPDTVGYTVPDEYHKLISEINSVLPSHTIISVHCHNDLGLAVANSIMAIKAGARQVETTINGIGERAGNASMEEVVMALNVRKDIFGYYTNINKKEIFPASRLVSRVTGLKVPNNKPVVGRNAFSHESGIHQDGMLKHQQTYEIMTPESVGRPREDLVLGRHSGKHGFKSRMKELGIELDGISLEIAYNRFQILADKKKQVYDDDLIHIVEDELRTFLPGNLFKIVYFHCISGDKNIVATATVALETNNSIIRESATGDGPVHATIEAINRIVNVNPKLEAYSVNAVTEGRDAVGVVTVTIIFDNIRSTGQGASTDIIEASAKAYINAVNRLLRKQEEMKKIYKDQTYILP